MFKTNKYIVWGAGGFSISLIYHYGIDTKKILFFVDNNKNNLDKKFIGLNSKIMPPTSILDNIDNFDFILIASMYHNDILRQIKQLRISIKVIILPNKIINI